MQSKDTTIDDRTRICRLSFPLTLLRPFYFLFSGQVSRLTAHCKPPTPVASPCAELPERRAAGRVLAGGGQQPLKGSP